MTFQCHCRRCGADFESYRDAMYCSKTCRYNTPIARFLKSIHLTENGCWNWTLRVNEDGYGEMKLHGKMEKAHRASWMLHRGPIPDGLQVLHRCVGNRLCVNPEHLYLGDNDQNVSDRVRQGREGDRSGVKNGRCKLTSCDVLQIKAFRGVVTEVELAARYKVAKSTVHSICSGESWRHLFLSPLALHN